MPRDLSFSARDWGLVAATLALLLDQSSKIFLLYVIGFRDMPGAHLQILPFFNLLMVWNPGISYGLFPAHGRGGTVLLAIFSVLAVGGLGWWLWNARRLALAIGLGLVIGGALGNLIDRLVYGKVADFFHFYAGHYDWYVFNVADCAITVGVAALLYDALLRPETATNNG
jgi:signal peptidase II